MCHSAGPAKSGQGWLPCFRSISRHPSCPRVSSPWSEPLASAWRLSLLCHHCPWGRLGCGTPHCSVCTWTNVSLSDRYKETLRDSKQTHAYVQLGQILDKIQKDQKALRPLPRNREQRQVPRVISAHTAPPRGWADPLSPSFGPTHPPAPTLTPFKGPASSPGEQQGNEFLVLCPLWGSMHPSKAWPDSSSGLFINFC